jgi:demethylmenaquinone methyltransferase / 2-methoxy-6-polyprenyl-1,4-benzoquinol methylase
MHDSTTSTGVDEHGERVQQMFDRIAHGYDRANRWMSLGTDVRWRRQAVSELGTDDGTPPAHVLDLCAGTLDSTLEIHRQFPQARITAGDFAAEMLEHGRTKLDEEAAGLIELLQMDAHSLPLPDDCVDAIFCAFGVRNLSDLPRATAEQHRCLRTGGRLVVLEFFRPDRAIPRAMHALYNSTVLPLVGWAATGDLEAYRYLPRSIGAFETVDAYARLLGDAGFTDVSFRPLTLGMAWVVRATAGPVRPDLPEVPTEGEAEA